MSISCSISHHAIIQGGGLNIPIRITDLRSIVGFKKSNHLNIPLSSYGRLLKCLKCYLEFSFDCLS